MRARAHLAVERLLGPDGTQRTRISRLRSDGPLALRPTIATRAEPLAAWGLAGPGTARVTRVAGAAGPLGGDDLGLDVEVGPGAALVLGEVSATLALPGVHGGASTARTTITVGAGATLVWLPEPVIAARGCDHHATTTVVLDPGARLLLREEVLLGRHGEGPGTVYQRLRVRRGGRALHDQELALGPGTPGWRSAAVTGGRRALGSLLVVDPDRDEARSPPAAVGTAVDSAVLALPGPAVLVTALADDGLTLRRRLDAGLARIESATATVPGRCTAPVPTPPTTPPAARPVRTATGVR